MEFLCFKHVLPILIGTPCSFGTKFAPTVAKFGGHMSDLVKTEPQGVTGINWSKLSKQPHCLAYGNGPVKIPL